MDLKAMKKASLFLFLPTLSLYVLIAFLKLSLVAPLTYLMGETTSGVLIRLGLFIVEAFIFTGYYFKYKKINETEAKYGKDHGYKIGLFGIEI